MPMNEENVRSINPHVNNDVDTVLGWLETQVRLGSYNENTGRTWGTAVRELTSMLAAEESRDVDDVLETLHDLANRWVNRKKKTPETATEYERRVRRAFAAFKEYRHDPAGWRPKAKRRRKNNTGGTNAHAESSRQTDNAKASSRAPNPEEGRREGSCPVSSGEFRYSLPESGVAVKDVIRIAYHLVTLAADWDPTTDKAHVFSMAKRD